MDSIETNVNTAIESSTPAPVTESKVASEKTSTAPEITPGVSLTDASGGDSVPPTYTPNTKFKVMDKEHEFDAWLTPHIKDAETEKKAKELYEKAYGLDYVKPKFEAAQKELGEYKTSYNNLYKDASEALTFKNNGDLDSFFQKVALSPEKVYEWVLEKLNRQNLPPDQRRVYDELDAKKRNEYQQSRQIEESENRYRQVATQAREAEVDFVLARPEIHNTVKNYDAKNGQGAFKQFVAEYGVMHFNAYGEDPSADTAISAVLKRLGDAYQGQQALTASPTASGEKPLPVIPNVSGKNVSPVRKSPRSIDDIKKIAAGFEA